MNATVVIEHGSLARPLVSLYGSGIGFMGVEPGLPAEGSLPPLPPVLSLHFLALVVMSMVGPYLFCCVTYAYHFSGLSKNRTKMRVNPQDVPKAEHRYNWREALARPEGITAVVAYICIIIVLGPVLDIFDVVPFAIKDLTPAIKPLVLLAYFLTFDFVMWCIHFCQHYWPWLYHHTHDQHHLIKSPTIVVALTGYLPDTCLLIIVPFHLTQCVVPCGNFVTVFAFASIALWHLHMIHSEFAHPWDPLLGKLGLVNTHDHHVHHLRPRKNLAHFFVMYDKMFGTYVDPASLTQLCAREKVM